MSGAVEGVREVAVKTEATRLLFEQIHREGGREVAGHRVTADMAIMAAGVLETVCHDLAAVLTTPPARSYADEDVARIIDPLAWQERERLLVRKAEWENRPVIEGVDFVAIYARDADALVAPSLAKAAAIRLLSQGEKA